MDRRTFLKFASAAALTQYLPACSSGSGSTEPEPLLSPNVVFISIDDLNDWIGALDGYPGVYTPNIDALAARGMLFRRAYCTAPSCNPSRTSVMTGLQPYTSGVYRRSTRLRDLVPEATTLPHYFKNHDYYVYGSGKIFHDHDFESFDEYHIRPQDPLPAVSPESASGIPCHGNVQSRFYFDWAALDIDDEEMSDAKVVNRAIDFLQDYDKDRPFFLGLGLFRPHTAWYVPKKYFDLYPLDSVILPNVLQSDLDDIPQIATDLHAWVADVHQECVLATNSWRPAVQAYLASISFADEMVGRFLRALEASSFAQNTIVVLWSDHGYHLGEKFHWHKHALWEKTTRVPLIINVPGHTRPGQVCDIPVSLIDLYPTLLDLCNLQPFASAEGQSLRPQLYNPSLRRERPAIMTWQPGNHAVRSDNWRYIRYKDGHEELYDHTADLREWFNLAGNPSYDGVKKDLATWMP